MKTPRHAPAPAPTSSDDSLTLSDADALAAMRGWYAGLSSCAAVQRYLTYGRRAHQRAA